MSSFAYLHYLVPMMLHLMAAHCFCGNNYGVEIFPGVLFVKPAENKPSKRSWLVWDPKDWELKSDANHVYMEHCEMLTSADNEDIGALSIAPELLDGTHYSIIATALLRRRAIDLSQDEKKLYFPDYA